MPIQAPQWTEFLSCPVCCNEFDPDTRGPVSLGCGHSICRACLANLHRKQCPFDQSVIRVDVLKVPLNGALVRLVGGALSEDDVDPNLLPPYQAPHYLRASRCIQDLAMYLKPFSSGSVSVLSRPMQRKLVTLANCQLLEGEGRARALRAARSLGERTVTELLLQHQNPQQLSANLWAAVRARGCQFLGPAMQEEVLKLVLLALEDGSALSRKVLVMFVVQRLEPHYSQASKTSIGHVVQLLYRASCFKVSKREGDSSLMQLKEEFRSYEALRREHDAQIVQIATEAGLRIAPDQWSALLYGDTTHKSHMQSIMDKLQTPQSFSQSVQELIMALQRSGDPGSLTPLRPHLELLAGIDPSPESAPPPWEATVGALEAAAVVVTGLADFIATHGNSRRQQDGGHATTKYKVSMCRDLIQRGSCPRGVNCTFAHSETELDRFRGRGRKGPLPDSNHEHGGPGAEPALTALTALPAAPPLYDPEVYTQPQGLVPPRHQYPANVNNLTESHWLQSDKVMGSGRGRTVHGLRQTRLEIVLLAGGQQCQEQDNCMQYDSTMAHVAKYGPISRQFGDGGVHSAVCGDGEQLPATLAPHEPVHNINASPHWYRARQQASHPDGDPHFYVQPPEHLAGDSAQRVKQLRHMERKMMDVRLIEDSHGNHLVDELRKIQDGLREEELYEAGIAEDMKELEQRWESELAEQERQWSETDTRPVN